MASSPQDEPLPEHYLVFVGPMNRPSVDTITVLARHGIDPSVVYRLAGWGFSGHLTDAEVSRLREDPEVRKVEQDTRARLAPHLRVDPEYRVEGNYLVHVRRSSDLDVVAARVGAEMNHVLNQIHIFAAYLTDDQVMALRRDPEVNCIEDDGYVYLDD